MPEDTDKGRLACKDTVNSPKPLSSELAGRTIALKDNITLAGIKRTNGTAALDRTPRDRRNRDNPHPRRRRVDYRESSL
jgi:amidase